MTSTDPWQVEENPFPNHGPMVERLRFLVRYAVLAPSSHNTQPWKFRISADRLDLFMDQEKHRTPRRNTEEVLI